MARVVGDIAVKVGADIGPLQQGMRNAGRSVDDFDSKTQKMAINVAKAGAAVVTAVAAIAGGVLKMASEAAKAGVEIQNLSQVANTNTTTFQRMADASRTVGIEQQKLADILKDVNDKVGDFIVTGGGPMADFFENIAPLVGVTADEFARLSGPDALQLYVSSLEKAGVNQQQMTFYMEALASDATALLPLLRNNGLEMNRLGDEAERAGRILSEETVAGAAQLDRELSELSNTLKMQATAAIIEHKDEIIALASFITDTLIPAISGLVDWIGRGVEGWKIIGQAASEAAEKMRNALAMQNQFDPTQFGQPTPEGQAGLMDYLASTNTPPAGASGGTGGSAADELNTFLDTPPAAQLQYSGRGSAAGPTADEILEAQAEAHLAAYEQRQAQLEELQELERGHASSMVDIKSQQEEELHRMREKYAQMEVNTRRQTADMAIGLLENLGKRSEVFAKAAVALNAAKSIQETIQNASAASVRALAELGPIAGPPAAAKILAFGKVQAGIIAANAALSLGGGRGGGGGAGGLSGGAGGSSTTTAAAQPSTQNVVIDLVGASGQQVDNFQQFADTLNEAARQGLLTNLSVRGA